jgi:hypothetical protein
MKVGASNAEQLCTAPLRVFAPGGLSVCSVANCTDKYYGNTYCKKHHQWHWKRGLLPKPDVATPEEKIQRFSKKNSTTGCWIWQRGLSSHGYGLLVTVGRPRAYAHRVSYEVFVGPISEGLEVCHRCDNPPCCNPEHLFLGTHLENMRDSANKGRAKQHRPQPGLKHFRASLSKEEVLMIRESRENSVVLGKKLGVSYMTVIRCRNRETYRDVP